ncbi:MAG TPA: plastocyanin/azurin family copper-binding protein [Acidimicrobiia bacterium]|nr:plastocyanin/azurin family copper-binding protein [Acidimicrobiia bacterium]
MKRVLVASVLGGLLLLGTPTLASSADRHGSRDNDRHERSDHRGERDGDRHGYSRHGYSGRYGYDRYRRGYYYGGDPYYYGGYDDCYRDRSGSTTCEPYGGDYDPGGYNGRYTYGDYDPNYCDRPHSAHSAQCEDPRGANNGVPPGTVVIRGLAFNPAEINSRVSEDVVWNFDDKGVAHTVTADDGSFDSGKMTDGEFKHAFDKPGTYGYHCSIHPDMKGMVTVGREA